MSKIGRGIYAEKDPVIKQKFNDDVADFVQAAKISKCKRKIIILESVGCKTSLTLIRKRAATAQEITVVSNDDHDFQHISRQKLNVTKCNTDIENIYREDDLGKHLVVIDDGIETGKYTLPRIKTLILRRIPAIDLMCNLCTRHKFKSHRYFKRSVIAFAKRQGYDITGVQLDNYTHDRSTMKPFQFTMRLK
jgi:hypoxanthine-guanine phosphoribosyltransferase